MELKKRPVEDELAEKEEIIAALTAQLEQAAEQLDRYQRAGGSPPTQSSSSATTEAALSQLTVLQDLARFLEQWDELQFGPTLGRLEDQVIEVRDLIANGDHTEKKTAPQDVNSLIAEMRRKQALAEQAEQLQDNADAADAEYESQSEDVAAHQISSTTEPDPTSHAGVGDGVSQAASSQLNMGQTAAGEPIPIRVFDCDPPAEIDLENASHEDVIAAIEHYRTYISALLKHVQMLQAQSAIAPPNWDELENYPEEFRSRIEQLEKQLEDRVRIAEVDLSMERARLARDEMRLQQLEMQINKRVFQLGLDPSMLDGFQGVDPNASVEDKPLDDKNAQGWKNLLGFNRGS